MNDHDLDLALSSMGQQRTAVADLPELHELVLSTAATAPRHHGWLPPLSWSFQSMFSATKFVVAGAVVALFGGLLLTGVLTQQGEEPLPGAVATHSASPVVAIDEAAMDGLGTFTPAGSPAHARRLHTATLLPDGRVLIVGGLGGDPYFSASAEVWEPTTATFSPVGSLAEPRGIHTATLLPDGRVLIVGGCCGGENYGDGIALAEVWDPAKASFEPAGSLIEGRFNHTATLLADGRVLILGREGNGPQGTIEAEIWDPATASFEPAASFAQGRQDNNHTVTLLADGRVLIVNSEGYEVWDPITASFGPAGSLGKDRGGHTATLLSDGRVLIVGGPNAPTSAEVWDPVTASFDWAGRLSEGRANHTAALLPDGRVLIVGGSGDGQSASEVWDPDTASFSPAGALAVGRLLHTSTPLSDGRVLVVGGDGGDEDPIALAEVWTLSDQ